MMPKAFGQISRATPPLNRAATWRGIDGVPVTWTELAEHAPDGLAVVDADRLFLQLNPAAVTLCGRPVEQIIGMPAPFDLACHCSTEPIGLFVEDGALEQVCTWSPVAGVRREFAYRTRAAVSNPTLTVVAFRDVTAERQRQRRVAAIARSSVKLASEGSIGATLDALAREVLRADALAGVQIMTLDDSCERLQIMGSAGFRHWSDFFDRLLQCQQRGAELHMIEALEQHEPVVVPDRWASIRSDPAWEPLHGYLGELAWASFASVPLMIRGRAAGIMNVFFAPGQVVGRRALEFLIAMADQAAVAVDYASLLQNERELARREERQRLARDLHDSIVQHVFSIGMQAKSMEVLGRRADTVPAESVRRIADEVGVLAKTVLADLRAMVHELSPTSSTRLGLEEAVRALLESTTNRTGLKFHLVVGPGLDQISADLTEDLYRIVAEAIHNVVKHAEADRVLIRIRLHDHSLRLSVIDNGCGMRAAGLTGLDASCGYGLTSMRERAERWGGTTRFRSRAGRGTSVTAIVPKLITVSRGAQASLGGEKVRDAKSSKDEKS